VLRRYHPRSLDFESELTDAQKAQLRGVLSLSNTIGQQFRDAIIQGEAVALGKQLPCADPAHPVKARQSEIHEGRNVIS
jgi:hypothetical protein